MPFTVFEELCRLFPGYHNDLSKVWYSGIQPADSAVVSQALSFLAERKISVATDPSEQRILVRFAKWRTDFEKQNLNAIKAAHFAMPMLNVPMIAELGWKEDNQLFVFKNQRLRKNRQIEFGRAWAQGDLLVRGSMVGKLMQAGLKGLILQPLDLGEDTGVPAFEMADKWDPDVPPLYRIWSETVLPLCKNWLCDNEGRVYASSDCKNGSALSPAPFTCALVYAKADLEPFLASDVVVTGQRFGRRSPELLVSQRFVKVLNDLGVKRLKFGGYGYHYTITHEEPWMEGVDGPRHPRYSGPPPAAPVD